MPINFSGSKQRGGAGTIYLKDNAQANGQIIIDNQSLVHNSFTPYLSDLNQTPTLHLKGYGQFVIPGGKVLQLDAIDSSIFELGTALWIAENGRIDLNSQTVAIENGTLIKDGKLGAQDQIDSLIIESEGVLTHSVRHLSGLKLTVVERLEIKAGGIIDVSAKGLLGGNIGSNSIGETYDQNGQVVLGVCNIGSYLGCGASYGGLGTPTSSGGDPNPVYGYKYYPDYLGSGGGGGGYSACLGGNGGGRVTLNTGNAIIDGNVHANGGDAPNPGCAGGGGSGGSILIFAEAISGNGYIKTQGGIGRCLSGCSEYGGDGGGGRVA
ncbi:MAG: hypothetical protein AAB316_23525, partial [Bacteroidota bacterium]